MSTSTTKSDYMLFFRGTNWDENLSAEKAHQAVGEFMSWFQQLTEKGIALSGHPLTNESKIVSGKKGRTVADGPFAEAKEAIGGYFYLSVTGMDEAVAIAQGCPALEHGLQVEVRKVADMCQIMERSQQALSTATA